MQRSPCELQVQGMPTSQVVRSEIPRVNYSDSVQHEPQRAQRFCRRDTFEELLSWAEPCQYRSYPMYWASCLMRCALLPNGVHSLACTWYLALCAPTPPCEATAARLVFPASAQYEVCAAGCKRQSVDLLRNTKVILFPSCNRQAASSPPNPHWIGKASDGNWHMRAHRAAPAPDSLSKGAHP
jgi:hypothetical protein